MECRRYLDRNVTWLHAPPSLHGCGEHAAQSITSNHPSPIAERTGPRTRNTRLRGDNTIGDSGMAGSGAAPADHTDNQTGSGRLRPGAQVRGDGPAAHRRHLAGPGTASTTPRCTLMEAELQHDRTLGAGTGSTSLTLTANETTPTNCVLCAQSGTIRPP